MAIFNSYVSLPEGKGSETYVYHKLRALAERSASISSKMLGDAPTEMGSNM